jgi:dTDP-4-dehydrorhamnose reductase
MQRLLITGASGLLGQHLARQALAKSVEVVGTYHTKPLDLPIEWHRLDITNPDQTLHLFRQLSPTHILHCAVQDRGPQMWPTTANGAVNMAQAAKAAGARLVHISTDVVFGGRPEPYRETDLPSPITPYGAAKAAAELAIQSLYPLAALVRTSLILSQEPPDKHQQMILEFSQHKNGVLFTDEIRCPIAAQDLAGALLELAQTNYAGVLHLAGPEALSRYELGLLVLQAQGLGTEGIPAGSSQGLGRPGRVVLDCARAYELLKAPIRPVSLFLSEHSKMLP